MAALSMAALSQNQPTPTTDLAAQNVNPLYELLDNIPNEVFQSVIEPLLLPVIEKVKAAKNENELLSILADAYQSMDDSALVEKLGDLMFVADVWGRLTMQEELGQ